VSRKTKIALPPGTELDFDNEDHRRHIEDEAFDDYDERPPRPTMRPPERSRYWWFWRFFAFFIRVPARRLWSTFSHWDLREGGLSGWVARYPLYPKIKDWLWRGRLTRLKRFVRWLVEDNYCCPSCGFDDYRDEIVIYADKDDTEGRTIELFEHVEGGGVDYWGEGQDAQGWLWCWRCGDVNWESV
jgi:hypothetical protein